MSPEFPFACEENERLFDWHESLTGVENKKRVGCIYALESLEKGNNFC